jgi:hypothetical protein
MDICIHIQNTQHLHFGAALSFEAFDLPLLPFLLHPLLFAPLRFYLFVCRCSGDSIWVVAGQ